MISSKLEIYVIMQWILFIRHLVKDLINKPEMTHQLCI